jgi:hypothetical protein
MIRFSAAIALAASLTAASPAAAQVEAGMLECAGTTASFIVGSVTELRCVFRPGGGAPAVPYNAIIRRVGVDIALPANVGLAWGVFAPTRVLAPGDLAGSYGGASASATAVVGAGANVLVGGSNNTISLQPLSLQGQTGLGVAAGVAGLELRLAR